MTGGVPSPEAPQVVRAPVAGRLVALGDVADPVFSSGMLGAGAALEPADDVALAPVSGTVTAETRSRHALVFRTDDGAEVLLHVGLDSASLRGSGFRQLVEKGARVRAGQPVLAFDRALMAERGLDDTVIVTVSNSGEFSRVDVVAEAGELSAGDALLRLVR